MPLNKSKGNMYSWCTHTHSFLAGVCPHKCSYCYVQAMVNRFGTERYTGELRILESEFDVKYPKGSTVFIEHMNDLFAEAVPSAWIEWVLEHCRKQEKTIRFVFQTKNPARYLEFLEHELFPFNFILGTTIETNRATAGNAPQPEARMLAMQKVGAYDTFLTLEPLQDFDVVELAFLVKAIQPQFVNIGADSKGHGLNEPSWDKVQELIKHIQDVGIEIKIKANLERLRK